MGIPFHKNKLWADNGDYIISSWNKKDRRGIVNVLYSNKSIPAKIKNVCSSILKNWKEEIILDIFRVYGKPHRGDHIGIALGHPELKNLALRIAKEMFETEKSTPETLPDHLYIKVQQIINIGKYPEWNKISDDESDNQ